MYADVDMYICCMCVFLCITVDVLKKNKTVAMDEFMFDETVTGCCRSLSLNSQRDTVGGMYCLVKKTPPSSLRLALWEF